MSELKNLTLIIPAKYEAETLPIFLQEIKNIGTKIKIVLEESDTKTIDSIQSLENLEIQFQTQKGYGAAIIEGIDNTQSVAVFITKQYQDKVNGNNFLDYCHKNYYHPYSLE